MLKLKDKSSVIEVETLDSYSTVRKGDLAIIGNARPDRSLCMVHSSADEGHVVVVILPFGEPDYYNCKVLAVENQPISNLYFLGPNFDNIDIQVEKILQDKNPTLVTNITNERPCK